MNLEEHLSNHPKKHLIFDLDKTLTRLEVDWKDVHKMLYLAVHTIDPSLAKRQTKNAQEYFNLVNLTITKHGTQARELLYRAMRANERDNYHGYTPNPSLIAFIHSHTSEYSFALWTSNSIKTFSDFMKKERLENVFEKIIALESVNFTKPNPDGFYKIYNENNSKQNYLMIGDSSNDEIAAKNAGIDFFKVDYFDRH